METKPLRFYIRINVGPGVYEVTSGENDNPLDMKLLLRTKDFRDASRVYVGAQSGIDKNYFNLMERVNLANGNALSVFESVGEFKWNKDAELDDNDGA